MAAIRRGGWFVGLVARASGAGAGPAVAVAPQRAWASTTPPLFDAASPTTSAGWKAQRLKQHRASREDDAQWRANWLAHMKENSWDSTRTPEEDFETEKLAWLEGRVTKRVSKFAELRLALFGRRKFSELSEREQTEWANMTEAIAVLDTHPDAIMVKDLGFDGGEPEAAEAPENPKEFCPIDVFDDQPWTTPFFPKPEMNEWEDEVSALQRLSFAQLGNSQIQMHAQLLKPGFAAWTPPPDDHILRFETQQFIELNPTARTDRRNAKVVLKVKVADLNLNETEAEVLAELATTRYDPVTDVLRLVGNRLPSAETNREYLKQLLTRLVVESKRVAAEVAK